MNNRIGKSKHGYPAAHVALALAAATTIIALLATPALAQNETVIYSFAGTPDGEAPGGNLIQDPTGNLYGVTAWGGAYNGGAVFELSLQNGLWVENILHSFGGPGDQVRPSGALVMDKAGNLYGGGGDAVYELSPDGDGSWTETILKAFSYPNGTSGGLTLDAAGRLYGTAFGGHCCGLVFRLSPPTKKAKQWKYLVLYAFRGSKYDDGAGPAGDLVFDAAGNLYGTTELGGTYNYGAVFELSPGPKRWAEKVLYSFQGHSDGGYPAAGLIFDPEGNLYGCAGFGNAGEGVVFELSPDGGSWTEAVLYSFTGGGDGGGPVGPLALHNGGLYGATECGGTGSGCAGTGDGVVFQLTSSGGGWTEQVLHTFTSSPDGSNPTDGVVFDSSGNLYGVTELGGIVNSTCGSYGCGVVYQISQ